MHPAKTSDQHPGNSVRFRNAALPPGVRMEVQPVLSISKPTPSIMRSQVPTLKWAQRDDSLLLTIDLPNAKDVYLILEPKGRLFFSATTGVQNTRYEVDVILYDTVIVNESKPSIGPRNIVYLIRKEQQKWWIRLLKKEGRTPTFIEIDLDRWEEGEEQDEPDTADQIVKGQEFEKEADKKLSGWDIFGSKHEDAGELYEKAANCYKRAKSWNQAGAVCVKLAQCYLKGSDGKLEAANAYADAGHAYKKTNTMECIACLEQAFDLFMGIGRLSMSARYCKKIAELYENELYENEQNLEQTISYYDMAADLFQGEEVTTSYQCRQKIAQVLAQAGRYERAIEIFEEIARQSLNNNLLKDRVRGHLLNAGICRLCERDLVAVRNALERYQVLDPTFPGTREHGLLADLAAAMEEVDFLRFTSVMESRMTEQDNWKKMLLSPEAMLLEDLDSDYDLT